MTVMVMVARANEEPRRFAHGQTGQQARRVKCLLVSHLLHDTEVGLRRKERRVWCQMPGGGGGSSRPREAAGPRPDEEPLANQPFHREAHGGIVGRHPATTGATCHFTLPPQSGEAVCGQYDRAWVCACRGESFACTHVSHQNQSRLCRVIRAH